MTRHARTIRSIPFALTATLAALAAVPLQAADLYWQGNTTGNLTDANYTTVANTIQNLSPAEADVLWIGGDIGNATLSGSVDVTFARLRVGHAASGLPYQGEGVVTVSNGATLRLTDTGSGANNTSVRVGSGRTGTLVIDGGNVVSSRVVYIGFNANQLNESGTVRIKNGGTLTLTTGNLTVGTSANVGQTGQPGHLIVENGTVNAPSALLIGTRRADSSFTLTQGAVTVGGNTVVGETRSGVNTPTFNMTGGTFTTGSHFFLGRGDSVNATLNLSGGDLTVGGLLLLGSVGNAEANADLPGLAQGITVNHTGGNLIATDVRVGDVGQVGVNDSTYNLSGTGVLTTATGGIVGRQGTGRFLQTGGTANFADILTIGNRDGAPNQANGLYKISAGTANIGASAASNALVLAQNGTGEFRVVGDDAAVNVNGNLVVNSDANGVGTLAFELETGDLLSRVNVTDFATFNAGSKLVFDVSNALPTQTTYDLLTASSIVDNGLSFTAPAGWTYQIVNGGNGQILQAVGSLIPAENADFNADGTVDGADFLAWQRGFGATSGATLSQGDANSDGAVNDADLTIWKAQFGTASAAPATAAVPEPASLAAALIAAAALFGVRSRRNVA